MENEDFYKEIIHLLIQAVNNRTRERNYFRLYAETIDKNNCSFENLPKEKQLDFVQAISGNENEYVIQQDNNLIVSPEVMNYLATHYLLIKDVDDFTDLCDLIGINDKHEMDFIDVLKENQKNKCYEYDFKDKTSEKNYSDELKNFSGFPKENYKTETHSNVDNIDLKK